MNLSVTGWNSFVQAQPLDPLSSISQCQLGALPGIWERSTNFLQSTWGTNTIAYTGNNTGVTSLNTTDATTIVQAEQWVVQTRMVNVGASINSVVSKVAFVRSGPYVSNQLEIAFGATNWTNVQLSFRDNLGTLGVYAGSGTPAVPVFLFAGTTTGNTILNLTIPKAGTYSLVLVLDNAGTWSTFEMEIIAL